MKNKLKKFNLDIVLVSVLSILFTLSLVWDSYHHINKVLLIICFIFTIIILNFTWNKLKNVSIKPSNSKILKREFIFYAILILIPIIVGILAYYPAYATNDTTIQWKQVQTNSYFNWHPVLHTLIFLKLPSLIYNNYISATIFQALFIISILLYFCYFLRKNFLNFKGTLLTLGLMVFNPIFIRYSVTLWKDIPYTWCLFLSTLFLINICLTNGKWLKTNLNKLFFCLSGIGILIFRHNGIAIFILMFLALILFYPEVRKFLSISFVGILAGFFIITGPVYKAFGIDGSTGGKGEMLGLVMGQLANYYNSGGGKIFNEEELELLDGIQPLEIWKEKYNPKSFNDIKWSNGGCTDYVSNNFWKIIKLWINKSLKYPKAFIRSYLNMTSIIWETTLKPQGLSYEEWTWERLILKDERIPNVSENVYINLTKYNNFIVNTPFRWLFVNFGQALFLILFALAIVIKRSGLNVKKWLPFLLVLCNTGIIMVMITGDDVRYIYSQVVCLIPLALYSLSNYVSKKEKSKFVDFCKEIFTGKAEKTSIQFIRYLFVGGVAAIVNIGMLYIFTEIFHIYYLISNILSFILGLIVNYILSKKLVFQDKTSISSSKEFLIYAIIGVVGLGFDTLLVWLFTDIMKVYYMLSKIISTLLVLIWNFVARKILYKIIK